MGTVKIVDVLDRANTVLNDATKVRWPFAELLGWYNDAQRAIIIRRPDANSQNTTFACVNDSLQSLPTTALRLIDIIRNEEKGTAIMSPSWARSSPVRPIRAWNVSRWETPGSTCGCA